MLFMLKGLYRMFNNKGQSLVLFVLIFPLLFLILMFVLDVGKMVLLKDELENINYLAMDYGLDKIDDMDVDSYVIDIIKKNKDDIDDIEVKIDNDKLYIALEDKIDDMFFLFSGIDIFEVKSSYVGYFNEDNKKVIERDK